MRPTSVTALTSPETSNSSLGDMAEIGQRELALGLLLEFRGMKSFLSPGVPNPKEY